MSFATPHDTAGATTLTLDDTSYTVTNIVISNTNPGAAADNLIDVAHLGQTAGSQAARMARPLVLPSEDGGSGRQFTFDYIGKIVIADAATGTYKITVAGSNLIGGSTVSYYTVQSSTLTLATNDVIRGQAVITVAR